MRERADDKKTERYFIPVQLAKGDAARKGARCTPMRKRDGADGLTEGHPS